MIELKSWPLQFGRIVGKLIDVDPRLNLQCEQVEPGIWQHIEKGARILYREYSPMSGMYSGREAIVTVAGVWRGSELFDPFTAMNLTIIKIGAVEMQPNKQPSAEMELPHD